MTDTRRPGPAVAVIIVAYNSADEIKQLIPSLLDVSHTLPLQIVVVDNRSTDSTAAVLDSFTDDITVILNKENNATGQTHTR